MFICCKGTTNETNADIQPNLESGVKFDCLSEKSTNTSRSNDRVKTVTEDTISLKKESHLATPQGLKKSNCNRQRKIVITGSLSSLKCIQKKTVRNEQGDGETIQETGDGKEGDRDRETVKAVSTASKKRLNLKIEVEEKLSDKLKDMKKDLREIKELIAIEKVMQAGPIIRCLREDCNSLLTNVKYKKNKDLLNLHQVLYNEEMTRVVDRESLTKQTFKFFDLDPNLSFEEQNSDEKPAPDLRKTESRFRAYSPRHSMSPKHKEKHSPKGKRGSPRHSKSKKPDEEGLAGPWHIEKEHNGIRTRYRRENDGTYTVRTAGQLEAPMFQVMSVCNETALSQNWVPLLKGSEMLHQCDKATQVIRHEYSMPWPVGNREVIMKAFGVDCLDDPLGSILLICRSPDEDETAAGTAFGKPVPPPAKNFTRVPINYLIFILTPKENGTQTELNIMSNVEPGVKGLPQSLISYLAKTFIRLTYSNIFNCVANFKGSDYEKEVLKNRELYGYLENRLKMKLSAK
eukprot:Platyproteum_vivax@DN7558_c0_g2_i5.p1